MRFRELSLPGAHVVELEPHADERGFLARAFCAREFADAGIEPPVAQANLSLNHRRGTLRGMHYQVEPAPEAKLVRCLRGAAYDVLVDMRPGSPTERRWEGVEITEDNGLAVYVPAGFAHGFLTLADDSLLHYQVSGFYTPEAERGVRWDDPAIGIRWPEQPALVSDKDEAWPLLG